FFERCPHLDETHGDQIAKEWGLEAEQIKHWFQNKRTKVMIKGRKSQDKMYKVLQTAKYMEIQMSQPESRVPTFEETCVVNRGNICDPDQALILSHWMEEEKIAKVADEAMAELLKLMTMNGPLWAKSSYGGGYILVREKYANMFPRVDNLNGPRACEESSKHYKVVRMGARKLVEMLLDSEEWVNFFPTIVSKSETVKVIDAGSLENQTGALQVVYEKMNALSHLVSSRELFFLRCCQQIKDTVWVIAHVSIDSFGGRIHDLPARRLPSGCMIYQITEEFSMVSWIEHVEVNDRMRASSQRGLVCNNIEYGAERWLWALGRMCDRFACISIENMPQAPKEVVNSTNARKRAMRLSNRMVQGFCRVLYKSRNSHSSEENNNEIIKISLRNNTTPEMPEGVIATAVTSVRLPVPPQNIFSFLAEAKNRSKWDVLSCGFPVNEITYFTIGGDRISIFLISNQIESNVMVFQDSYKDCLGSYVVHAPISLESARMIMDGEDSTVPKILPSGFLISEDNGAIAEASHANNRSGSSLLTIAYQFLISINNAPMRDQYREAVVGIVSSTLHKIKTSLNISDY
ncbi:Homeobox-leucine zipper protein HDG8, partial [Mucuna pruriens]